MNEYIGIITSGQDIIDTFTIRASDEISAGNRLAQYTYETYNQHHDTPHGWYRATILRPRPFEEGQRCHNYPTAF